MKKMDMHDDPQAKDDQKLSFCPLIVKKSLYRYSYNHTYKLYAG